MRIVEILEQPDVFWYEDTLADEVKQFIGASKSDNINMGCQDESHCWATKIKQQFPNKDIEIVDGMFGQDTEFSFDEEGHTWVTIDGSIFDPTAAQFDCYPNIYANQYTAHETTGP